MICEMTTGMPARSDPVTGTNGWGVVALPVGLRPWSETVRAEELSRIPLVQQDGREIDWP